VGRGHSRGDAFNPYAQPQGSSLGGIYPFHPIRDTILSAVHCGVASSQHLGIGIPVPVDLGTKERQH
jgi:hypothetical protein